MTIKLALLMTGNELMLGDITDSNSAMIAQKLRPLGLSVDIKVTVGDQLDTLTDKLQWLDKHYDIVIVNGGLGPTQDDLSCEAIGKAFDLKLADDAKARQHVINWCQQRNFAANEANLKQALLPETATIFPDAPGSASGFYLQQKSLLIVTPGVPSELESILENHIKSLLKVQFKLKPAKAIHYYQLFGIGESSLQNLLHKDHADLETHYDIGFRAGLPLLELKLITKEPETNQAKKIKAVFLQAIRENIVAEKQAQFGQMIIELFQEKNLTLGFAESCTGGLLAAEITKNPGSSTVLNGSIVSYSNDVKQRVLSVQGKVLNNQGAVSKACAKQMLQGAFEQLNCDYAAAVTGIAGPSGGTEDKPVGTVYLAFGNAKEQHAYGLNIPFPRNMFQTMVTALAMDMLRRQVTGLSLKPRYLERYLLE